jgi:hypothetical protein
MRAYVPVCIGLLLATCAAAAGARAADDGAGRKPDAAQALFRSAFEDHLAPAERVEVLERVAKEHSDSPWADDALWVLGEAARRQHLTMRVLYYWQFLVTRWPAVHLEDYTRSLEFYHISPVGCVEHLLEMQGDLFLPQRGHVIPGKEAQAFAYKNAVAFNPAPMLVWEELGDCYALLDKQDLAAEAYARSLAAAPPAGDFARSFRVRVNDKMQLAGGKASAVTPAATPAASPEKTLPPAASAPPADAAKPPGPSEPAGSSEPAASAGPPTETGHSG